MSNEIGKNYSKSKNWFNNYSILNFSVNCHKLLFKCYACNPEMFAFSQISSLCKLFCQRNFYHLNMQNMCMRKLFLNTNLYVSENQKNSGFGNFLTRRNYYLYSMLVLLFNVDNLAGLHQKYCTINE